MLAARMDAGEFYFSHCVRSSLPRVEKAGFLLTSPENDLYLINLKLVQNRARLADGQLVLEQAQSS
jgi:hypothetical protein